MNILSLCLVFNFQIVENLEDDMTSIASWNNIEEFFTLVFQEHEELAVKYVQPRFDLSSKIELNLLFIFLK